MNQQPPSAQRVRADGDVASQRPPHAREGTLLRLLIFVPLISVLLVAVSWVAAHSEHALVGARVYGTHFGTSLNLRAICTQVEDDLLRPLSDEVTARVWALGQEGPPSLTITSSPGDDGVAALNGSLPDEAAGPLRVELSVSRTGQLLGTGEVRQTPRPNSVDARRGGWIDGKVDGPLALRVGLMQGVLAVPFPAELVIEVRRDGEPVDGYWVSPPGIQGGKVLETVSFTDADGRAKFTVVPEQHVVELSWVLPGAVDSPSEVSSWFGHLPVVAGALYSRVQDGRLWVSSPVERAWVYVDWYSAGGLSAGDPGAGDTGVADMGVGGELTFQQTWTANVRLRRDNEWFTGIVDIPAAVPLPGFAVTSSEPDLQSMALVGWPVGGELPRATLDLRSPLLFDGLAQARRAVAERTATIRGYGSLAALFGALLESVCLVLLVTATRSSDGQRSDGQRSDGQRSEPPSATHGGFRLVSDDRGRAFFAWAGACVVLALVALAALSWFS